MAKIGEKMTAKKQRKVKQNRSVWKPALLLFLILALLIAACACRQSETPIQPKPPIEVKTVRLCLCATESDNEADWQTALTVNGMDGLQDATFTDIRNDITQGIGDKSDRVNKKYFAVSFYLINNSEVDVSYDMSVNVTKSTGKILDAVRVMIVEGGKSLSQVTQEEVFAKPEATQAGNNSLAANTGYTTTDFVSDTVIYSKRFDGLKKTAKVKKTIVVWLEGWDIDCTNAILSQSFSLEIDISAVTENQTA